MKIYCSYLVLSDILPEVYRKVAFYAFSITKKLLKIMQTYWKSSTNYIFSLPNCYAH